MVKNMVRNIIIACSIVFVLGIISGIWVRGKFIKPCPNVEQITLPVTNDKPASVSTSPIINTINTVTTIANTFSRNKETTLDFSPSLTLNIGGIYYGKFELAPALGISFFKYSKNNKVLFMFPELQVTTVNFKDFGFLVVPFGWNIGYYLPLIDNTYLKPLIGIKQGSLAIGAGLGLNF